MAANDFRHQSLVQVAIPLRYSMVGNAQESTAVAPGVQKVPAPICIRIDCGAAAGLSDLVPGPRHTLCMLPAHAVCSPSALLLVESDRQRS